MLSVLIPVYKFDVRKLVHQIIEQCNLCQIQYEVILLNDASGASFEFIFDELKFESSVRLFENETNCGRAASRNRLYNLATYDWLLFLDCDVQLIHSNFIRNYLEAIQSNKNSVYYGSCCYDKIPPTSLQLKLHWKYGIYRENPPISKRKANPYQTFHTVNFIAHRSILKAFPFDESLSIYGHEDSLWAKTLETNSIQIAQIENEVLHIGLYNSRIFLRKTASSIKNLLLLEFHKKNLNTKLQSTLKIIQSLIPSWILFTVYKRLERKLVQNLLSNDPKLIYLDIYKVGLYLRFRKKYTAYLRTKSVN